MSNQIIPIRASEICALDSTLSHLTISKSVAIKTATNPPSLGEEVTKQGYPGWKIIDRYQELTAQMGYKWPRKWGTKQ